MTYLSIVFGALLSFEFLAMIILKCTHYSYCPKIISRKWKYQEGHDFDPVRGYRCKPNCRYANVQTGRQGFVLNSLDIPEPNLKKKNPGIFRIFMFGGSTTAGSGASHCSKTIAAQLESKLNAMSGSVRFEVINLGVGAYASPQEMFYFLDMVRYSPELVIVYDGWNDFIYPVSVGGYLGEWDWELSPSTFSEFYLYLKFLARENSYNVYGLSFDFKKFVDSLFILQLAKGIFRKLKIFPGFSRIDAVRNTASKFTLSYRQAADLFWRNMNRFIGCARGNKTKIAYFIQPIIVHKKTLTDKEKKLFNLRPELVKCGKDISLFYSELSRYIDSSGVDNHGENIIDISGTVENISDEVFIDECHMNDYGYGLIAERIKNELINHNFLGINRS